MVPFIVSVPANSSRLFSSFNQAKLQPTASLGLELSLGPAKEGYLYNVEFDASKIKYDGSYCSENKFHEERSWKNIQNVLQRLRQDFPSIQVIDIGCGQGEIVSKCEKVGISSIGFDPTLRRTGRNLIKRYFSAENLKDNPTYSLKSLHVFVMRCVLPHIRDPLEFLNEIFNEFPTDMIYIEFQNLDKIVKARAWYSFMHDHVNYFTIDTFKSFNILDSGHFGEWSWCFFGARSNQRKNPIIPRLARDWSATLAAAEQCIQHKEKSLHKVANSIMKLPMIVYSAAGKAINFSYAATMSGLFENITSLDISENKHGKFMECSGVQVLSLDEFCRGNTLAAGVVILNREHEVYARKKIAHLKLFITLPKN